MKLNPQFSPSKLSKPTHHRVLAPIPAPFSFDLGSRHPLVPIRFAACLLNKTTDQVADLIDDGQLRWAFDIRSPGRVHREVRILRQSLFEFLGLIPKSTRRKSDDDNRPGVEAPEFDEVIDLVLPPGFVMTAANLAGLADGSTVSLSPARFPAEQLSLFPREPVLRGTQVAECFSCNSQHVMNLLRQNSLRAVNLKRGPKATPLILRSSVTEFLRERRVQ